MSFQLSVSQYTSMTAETVQIVEHLDKECITHVRTFPFITTHKASDTCYLFPKRCVLCCGVVLCVVLWCCVMCCVVVLCVVLWCCVVLCVVLWCCVMCCVVLRVVLCYVLCCGVVLCVVTKGKVPKYVRDKTYVKPLSKIQVIQLRLRRQSLYM
jgi:hypothetical protein